MVASFMYHWLDISSSSVRMLLELRGQLFAALLDLVVGDVERHVLEVGGEPDLVHVLHGEELVDRLGVLPG